MPHTGTPHCPPAAQTPGRMTAVMRAIAVTGPKVLRVGVVRSGRVVADLLLTGRRQPRRRHQREETASCLPERSDELEACFESNDASGVTFSDSTRKCQAEDARSTEQP